MDKTIHAINTISGLLQGPFDVGNALVGHQGIMEMMVALCGSEREVDQMVAVEALIHSSSKMSRASFIITNGVSLLKDIYKKTKNERIKIRALVVSERRQQLKDTSVLNSAWVTEGNHSRCCEWSFYIMSVFLFMFL